MKITYKRLPDSTQDEFHMYDSSGVEITDKFKVLSFVVDVKCGDTPKLILEIWPEEIEIEVPSTDVEFKTV
jgi:hypothetical protein